MCQQASCVRPVLLLVLGFLMIYDNQATSVEKRAQAAGDVNNKPILKAVKNLKNTMDTLVESVDKLRRKSKKEAENLKEEVQRLENKTEQINERLENKTEQINERLENKTEQINERIVSVSSMTKILVSGGSSGEFHVSSVYKGKIYLLTKVEKTFDIDRDEARCESLGGYLFEPDDLDEVKFVAQFVKDKAGNFNTFTGINDINSEGNFVHKFSGDALKVDVWWNGQPNGGDCTVLYTNRKLQDTGCSYSFRYVCEVYIL